uniref:Uncharacterized protein n=1 Tax=Chlamydomonas leiostraca TaxID=1034604 RepID=A0A7S0R662_9CHLO|eukprot:CAMPEP_0202865546 /NCGR_PEP_ID=MMETSP1391-20130828/6226_1 /ASSEMBLY_ACC=CAM_ASM_000867 /TAXON_ID=1034604 /ORGANISM="Chlamydomonas leiostraca, Strain SAG 11-49" /LENGTH=170 /DNA_ID=CAMNT_0049545405 /DNA_START=51 /DNA_END=563 /DNA_ORIENTATION=-
MSSSRGLIFALGGVGLGYGAYFATVQSDVSKYEAEAAQVARMVVNEKKALQSAEKGITEQENRIKELSKKEATTRQELSVKEAALEEARKVVERLEAEYSTVNEELHRCINDSSAATGRLAKLRGEVQRAKEALTMGEKSLTLAKKKASEGRNLYNPLNHPKVVGLMGRK